MPKIKGTSSKNLNSGGTKTASLQGRKGPTIVTVNSGPYYTTTLLAGADQAKICDMTTFLDINGYTQEQGSLRTSYYCEDNGSIIPLNTRDSYDRAWERAPDAVQGVESAVSETGESIMWHVYATHHVEGLENVITHGAYFIVQPAPEVTAAEGLRPDGPSSSATAAYEPAPQLRTISRLFSRLPSTARAASTSFTVIDYSGTSPRDFSFMVQPATKTLLTSMADSQTELWRQREEDQENRRFFEANFR